MKILFLLQNYSGIICKITLVVYCEWSSLLSLKCTLSLHHSHNTQHQSLRTNISPLCPRWRPVDPVGLAPSFPPQIYPVSLLIPSLCALHPLLNKTPPTVLSFSLALFSSLSLY